MKYLFFLLISLNIFAAPLVNDKPIKASDLNEQLNFLFQLYYKSGLQEHSITGVNFVQVSGRILNFTKKYDETKLVLSYSDVFRVHGAAEKMCAIVFEIEGQPCTNGPLFKSIYINNSQDINTLQIDNVCTGIPKGNHSFRIKAKANAYSYPGNAFINGICEFSWSNNSTYLMTVKESY